MWQFSRGVDGISEAAVALSTPVVSGNVSFYNENPDGAVYPTPVIGMVGLIEDLSHITPAYFRQESDLIYLVGETKPEIGGSEFLKEYYNRVTGDCPTIDLEEERSIQQGLLEVIRQGLIQSAHDVSDGGLAVTLAEACILNRDNPFGAVVNLEIDGFRPEWFLFSESQSRFIISIRPQDKLNIENAFQKQAIPITFLGKVKGQELKINDWIQIDLKALDDIYFNTLNKMMTI
jgi:phosphoribosylformylglycinamidine synthase